MDKERIVARFEKGKPADPTQNMSPEQAAKWREMNEEHKDKFKTASSMNEWLVKDYPILQSRQSEYYIQKELPRIIGKSGFIRRVRPKVRVWDYDVRQVTGSETRVDIKVEIKFEGLEVEWDRGDEELRAFFTIWEERGKAKAECRFSTSRHKLMIDSGSEIVRVREGDPDRVFKELVKEVGLFLNDRLKDARKKAERKLAVDKSAATTPTLKSVATRDCKLISRMVSERMQVDWVTSPRSEEYQRYEKEEGFHEFKLPRAKKELAEINDIIEEATTRLVRRLIGFERGSMQEFDELGYDVKLGKVTPVFGARDWADYDFRQKVTITDKVMGGTQTLDLTWGFRDFVRMSDRGGWTSFDSDGSDGQLTFIRMALYVKDRMHKQDWPRFLEWRKEKMEEKGYKAASTTADEELVGRFEEGKPADPTKNMSPEDAKKWREEHQKNKDKFKKKAESVVGRYLESARRPRSTPERHQLKILIDTVKNPLKGKFLGGPTAEEAEETLREEFDYSDAEIRRLKTAGFSYATDRMSVLFVEGRKPVPFNIDTIRAINRTEVPVIGDDGEIHDVFVKVIGNQYSGPLTYNQEQMGMRRETRVDLQIPVDEGGTVDTAERTVLAEMAKLGKKFGFTVEPVRMGYKPKTRTVSRFKKVRRPSKKFPFMA
jgi:hypothetical protein